MLNDYLSQKISDLTPAQRKAIAFQAQAEKILRDRYGSSFRNFIKQVFPDYKFYRFNEKIIDALEKVERGEINRLMIFLPPRFGKSTLASQLFPAYYLFKNPEKHVGLCSYSSELAYSLSRYARDNYEKTGRHLSEDASSVKEWHTNLGGVFWSSGVGGSQTGKGFSCFPSGTIVNCVNGNIPIENINVGDMVFSFNHESNNVEQKKVAAIASRPASEFIRIKMDSGSEIICTPEHPIYCGESGYREAQDILPGQAVIKIQVEQDLFNMRSGHKQACDMRRLRKEDKRGILQSAVCKMREDFRALALRCGETVESWSQRFLLWVGMFQIRPCYETSPSLPFVRQYNDNSSIKILPAMQSAIQRFLDKTRKDTVPRVWDTVRANVGENKILFKGLSEQSTFKKNAWQREQPLQGCEQLRGMVQENAPADFGARQSSVRCLRDQRVEAPYQTEIKKWWGANKIQSSDTSHRSKSIFKSARKFSDALFGVPQETSSENRRWEADSVSVVERIHTQSQPVYDIQVEENHNFFAGGILVHNCGIIDDPTKNWEEALSSQTQDSIWDWYRSTFYTRKSPQAKLIVIQTRWSENDLSGKLLNAESYAPENWHIINFQAVREKNNVVKIPVTCTMEEDWRKDGEVLCPEMFSEKEMKNIRNLTETGSRVWQALYQQNPVAEEGVIWKKQWFENCVYDDASDKNIVNVGYDWDTAYTSDESNAAHAYVKAGVGNDGYIYVSDLDFRWVEFPEFIQWTVDLPNAPHYVEKKASGKSIVPMLNKVGLRAVEVPVFGGDKVSRTVIASPIVEKGKVKIHRSILTRLLYDDRQGILKFPNGTHKDLNDAFVQMLNRLKPYTKSVEQKKPEFETYDQYMESIFADIHKKFHNPVTNNWWQL